MPNKVVLTLEIHETGGRSFPCSTQVLGKGVCVVYWVLSVITIGRVAQHMTCKQFEKFTLYCLSSFADLILENIDGLVEKQFEKPSEDPT